MDTSAESSERDTLTIRRDALLDKKRIIDAIDSLKERAPGGKTLQTNLRYFVRSTRIRDYGRLQGLFDWFNGEGIGVMRVSKAGTSVTGGWGQYGVGITIEESFERYAVKIRDEYHSIESRLRESRADTGVTKKDIQSSGRADKKLSSSSGKKYQQIFHGPVGQVNQGNDAVSNDGAVVAILTEYISSTTEAIKESWARHPLTLTILSGTFVLLGGVVGSATTWILNEPESPAPTVDSSQADSPVLADDLRVVQNYELKQHVSRLPDNVYGFTYGFKLSSEFHDEDGGQYIDLESGANQHKFELQKISNRILIVGFVDLENYRKIIDASQENLVEIKLFSHPWQEVKYVVAIPYDSLKEISDEKISYFDEFSRQISLLTIETAQMIPNVISHYQQSEKSGVL